MESRAKRALDDGSNAIVIDRENYRIDLDDLNRFVAADFWGRLDYCRGAPVRSPTAQRRPLSSASWKDAITRKMPLSA
jgi:hypothetical protein